MAVITSKWPRLPGGLEDVRAELADVVITTYVVAEVFGIDLDAAVRAKLAVVFARPWREPRPAGAGAPVPAELVELPHGLDAGQVC